METTKTKKFTHTEAIYLETDVCRNDIYESLIYLPLNHVIRQTWRNTIQPWKKDDIIGNTVEISKLTKTYWFTERKYYVFKIKLLKKLSDGISNNNSCFCNFGSRVLGSLNSEPFQACSFTQTTDLIILFIPENKSLQILMNKLTNKHAK